MDSLLSIIGISSNIDYDNTSSSHNSELNDNNSDFDGDISYEMEDSDSNDDILINTEDININDPSEEDLFEINTELDLNELGDKYIQNLMLKYFNNPYYKTSKYIACIIDKDIIKYCKRWSLNRKLNLLHWNRIYNFYKYQIAENSELDIANVISLALFSNNFYILDGQHRIKALETLIKDYTFDCKIRVDLYMVDSYDEMIKILSEINTTNPLDIESLLMGNISGILAYIKSNYSNGNRNILTYKKSKRPFINEPKLVEKIKNSKFLISTDIKKVCKLIHKMNIDYSNLDLDYLRFGKKKISISMMNKAMEYSCFLGFDNEFNWVDKIDKIFEKKFVTKSKCI